MRKLLALFLAAIFCTLSAFAKIGPIIEFETTSHDFGIIKEENGCVSYVFEFTNKGETPLVIISAIASCGCTTPQYPKEPISPGKSGKIKVTYNPSGRPGEFDKSVKVRYNSAEADKGKVVLKITGTVLQKGKN